MSCFQRVPIPIPQGIASGEHRAPSYSYFQANELVPKQHNPKWGAFLLHLVALNKQIYTNALPWLQSDIW